MSVDVRGVGARAGERGGKDQWGAGEGREQACIGHIRRVERDVCVDLPLLLSAFRLMLSRVQGMVVTYLLLRRQGIVRLDRRDTRHVVPTPNCTLGNAEAQEREQHLPHSRTGQRRRRAEIVFWVLFKGLPPTSMSAGPMSSTAQQMMENIGSDPANVRTLQSQTLDEPVATTIVRPHHRVLSITPLL